MILSTNKENIYILFLVLRYCILKIYQELMILTDLNNIIRFFNIKIYYPVSFVWLSHFYVTSFTSWSFKWFDRDPKNSYIFRPIELNWIELNWIELNWIELNSIQFKLEQQLIIAHLHIFLTIYTHIVELIDVVTIVWCSKWVYIYHHYLRH